MSTSSRKVRTLTLKQLTVFEKAVFEFSPGINVLIGSNSTGKTHLLKIIYTMLKVCKELYNMKGSADIIKNKDHVADMLLYGLFEKILRTDIDCFIRQNNEPYADKKITDIRLGYADKELNIHIHPKELNYTEELPEPLPAIFLPAQEFLSINEGFISAYTHRELP